MNIKDYFYCLVVIFVSSCNNTNSNSIINQPENNQLSNEIESEEDFRDFLSKFNSDSIFQINRVIFPLNYHSLDDDYNPISERIERNEYLKMNFEYSEGFKDRDYDKYTQEIIINGDSAIIEIRGIENGIHSDVLFKKVKGKWYLKEIREEST